jgi:FkbM family methyltransferase
VARDIAQLPSLPASTLDAVLARNEYGVYCIPRAANGVVARTVRRARVWERETIDLISRTPGDVVHAGTFFGDFLPALSASREATVWAFEPSRENHRCASVTVCLNDLQNVVLMLAALSDRPGRASLTTSTKGGLPAGGAGRLLAAAPEDRRESETVPLVTVDECVPGDRHVGVVHLDVEGHEEQALAGALATISRCEPLLIVESLPSEEWLAQHLPAYRLTEVVNGNNVLRPE